MNKRTLMSMVIMAGILLPQVAWSQPSGECTQDSQDEACGTPDQSGGGGCGCGGGSILIANTDEGDSYQYADDFDDDGFEDNVDNCPFTANADQQDSDSDGYGNACDNCVMVTNDQVDIDDDGNGDACDGDADNDGIENEDDNCPAVPNPAQADLDGDGIGNACDADDDNDGCEDAVDNCPLQSSGECQDTGAVIPNECFDDEDADQIPDQTDNCPGMPNADQADSDEDGYGDACDVDLDNDGAQNQIDNCVNLPNPEQGDDDRDFLGNACDPNFCFAVDGDVADCLDPTAPFMVKAQAPVLTVETGEEVQLNIFANRSDKAIRYTWTSDGGVIRSPKGSVSVSEVYNYRYVEPPLFYANEPGSYEVKLSATLAFADELYDTRSDEDHIVIEVVGDPKIGCNNSGVGIYPVWIAALFGLVRLRYRRE